MNKSHFVSAGMATAVAAKIEAANIPWSQVLTWIMQFPYAKVIAAIDQVLSTIAPGSTVAQIVAAIDALLNAKPATP